MIHQQLKDYGFDCYIEHRKYNNMESDTFLHIVKDGAKISLSYAAIFALKEQIIELTQVVKDTFVDRDKRKKKRELGYTETFLQETLNRLITAEEYEKANDIKETLAKLTA